MSAADLPTALEKVVAEASCPRCGHSQLGALHPEAQSWPLMTACSECGLEIRWSEYVESQFDLPVWWIEHAPWRRWLVALPLTILAGAVGWPFWGRLRLAHPPRIGRLVAAVVAVYFAVFLGIAVLEAKGALAAVTRSPFPPSPLFIILQDSTGKSVGCEATWQPPSWEQQAVALKPFLLRPTSLAYTSADSSFAVGRAIDLDEVRRRPSQSQRWSGIIVNVQDPLGATLPASVPYNTVTGAPLLPPRMMPPPRVFWTGVLKRASFPIGFTMSLAIVATATFVVLPIARRRAKVRWVHVVRAGLYAMLGPAALTIAGIALLGLRAPTASRDLENLMLFTVFLAPVSLLHVAWWRLAAGSYLRMSRPGAIALSVATIALLAATAIAVELT